MIQKKICMLGAFAVGKTSLVRRFVDGLFSDRYLTTIGVKIDQKRVSVEGGDVNLILWDLHGEDEFQKLRLSYLRGSSGCFLVADGTRKNTLEAAFELKSSLDSAVGPVPCLLLLNKSDLGDQWEVDPGDLENLRASGWKIITTSAKTGSNVEDAFQLLAQEILGGRREADSGSAP